MIATTNETKLFGILGTPIKHTLSPAMHSYMAEKYHVDMAYIAFDVSGENLKKAIDGVKAIGAKGFNITAPHKIAIMDCIDVINSEATYMGSVNTVVNKDGIWHGYNTDGDGYCHSLTLEGFEISDKKVLVMGAGGAARSVCYKLAENGAESITVATGSDEKKRVIGDMLEKNTKALFCDSFDRTKLYDLIINTTPAGMHPLENENPCRFMDCINKNTVCSDLIYNPIKTVFLKEASARGAKIHNGLGMLICQGILAFELFTGEKTDKKKTYEELINLFNYYRI